jgi:hypothetical protein
MIEARSGAWPDSDAFSKGVNPSLAAIVGSAPLIISTFTT